MTLVRSDDGRWRRSKEGTLGGLWYAVSPSGNQVSGASSSSGGGYSSGY